MQNNPKLEVNWWVFLLALLLVILSIVLLLANTAFILNLDPEFKEIYSFAGNTVTLLCGLETILLTLIALAVYFRYFLDQKGPLWLLNQLNKDTAWIQKTDRVGNQAVVRKFFLEVQRAAVQEELTDGSLRTISTASQFLPGVRIPKDFLERRVELLVKKLSKQRAMDTYRLLTVNIGTHLSSDDFMLLLLAILVRCGYHPTIDEFNRLWIYALNLLENYSSVFPRSLTKADKVVLLEAIGSIAPKFFSKEINRVNINQSTLTFHEEITRIIGVK